MARRSSARLRERNTSTPKRTSLAQDASIDAPRTMPAKLTALHEAEEMPRAFPSSSNYPSINIMTPTKASSIQPSEEEMHPQRHYQSTAKPRDEARHLGFSSMLSQTEPANKGKSFATLQTTPSRIRYAGEGLKPPALDFTFRREHSLQLSPDAKRLMEEKREETAKIREQMAANGEDARIINEVITRKIATPKGRFSQAHMEQFKRMESIEGHASAFRADPNRPKPNPVTPASQKQISSRAMTQPLKSLKRSPSKAELDSPPLYPKLPDIGTNTTSTPISVTSYLPRAGSMTDTHATASNSDQSPAKRVKHGESDDVSTSRQNTSEQVQQKPTPKTQIRPYLSNANLSSFASPTASSVKRTASIKTSKIPAPAITLLKAKGELVAEIETSVLPRKPSTLLLACSPSKPKLFQTAESSPGKSVAPIAPTNPLLFRTPSKLNLFGKAVGIEVNQKTSESAAAPLLAQSPTKNAVVSGNLRSDELVASFETTPLLSRSPMKASILQESEPGKPDSASKTTGIPYLARSPSKFSLKGSTKVDESVSSLNKEGSGGLMSRFNLLRKSPVKSILRSPQRLYSDDMAKVAAGTHFATPPHACTPSGKKPSASIAHAAPQTPATQKHVDFTSSTKAREKGASSTPKSVTPSPTPRRVMATISPSETKAIPYPDLVQALSPSPQKRRLTSTPRDFTFHAGDPIIFGQSPRGPPSAKTLPTIRHVSMDISAAPAPVTGSKKRKLDFESTHPAGLPADEASATSDKENEPVEDAEKDIEDRPAKRVKHVQASTSPVKTAAAKSAASAPRSTTKRQTLGVKPKKITTTAHGGLDTAKKASSQFKASTISRDRLNALSQPKRRV